MSYTQSASGPVRIISADLLIADKIVELKDNPQLVPLVHEYQSKNKLKPGGKISIDAQERNRFEALMPAQYELLPGGSSANTLATLSKLNDAVEIDFFGVAGKSKPSHHADAHNHPDTQIRKGLGRIRLLKEGMIAQGEPPESSLSYVIRFDDGERTIATYPGNARQKLTSELISRDTIKNSDILLVQGSLWQKLDETFPVRYGHAPEGELGFADKLLNLRWKLGKELWLAMPTQADFGTRVRSHADKAEHFRTLIASANVVLSNGEELSRVYTSEEERADLLRILKERNITEQDLKQENAIDSLVEAGRLSQEEAKRYDFANKSIAAETALQRLHDDFKKDVLAWKKKQPENESERWTGNTGQTGFITLGKKGAAVVTKEGGIEYVPAMAGKVTNTLGAGDTAYAGFAGGYLAGLAPRDAAVVGMLLAGWKLQENGPRLSNPKDALRKAALALPEATPEQAAWKDHCLGAVAQVLSMRGVHPRMGIKPHFRIPEGQSSGVSIF